MNKSTFDDLLTHIQALERQVRDDGQREYAQDIDNVFANFDRVATHLNLTREQVLLVYALKHWDGIIAYINGHKSQREDIRGRIKDLRLYLALLWGMVDEERNKEIDWSTQVGPPKGPGNITFGLADLLPRPPKVSTNDGDVHLKRGEPHHYTCDCCECNRY